MIDFPPRLRARTDLPPTDLRSPARFLVWLMRIQPGLIALGSLSGLIWFLPPALAPYAVGRAIDRGILAGDVASTILWCVALFVAIGIGTTMGILWHTFVVRTWVVTLYGTMELVVAKVVELGHVLPRRTPTGEVLSVSSGDSDVFGAVLEVTERTFAALGAFLLLVWLMISTSPKLGLIVLVASPLLVASSFFLLRPLHHAQEVERKRSSELTSRVTDIVAGLRILRGIGGEDTFGANYATQSQLTRRAGVDHVVGRSTSTCAGERDARRRQGGSHSGRSDQFDTGEVGPVTLGVASEEPVSGHRRVCADVEARQGT